MATSLWRYNDVITSCVCWVVSRSVDNMSDDVKNQGFARRCGGSVMTLQFDLPISNKHFIKYTIVYKVIMVYIKIYTCASTSYWSKINFLSQSVIAVRSPTPQWQRNQWIVDLLTFPQHNSFHVCICALCNLWSGAYSELTAHGDDIRSYLRSFCFSFQ